MDVRAVNGMKTRLRTNWWGQLILQVQDTRFVYGDDIFDAHCEAYWRDARTTDIQRMERPNEQR